VDPSGWAGAAVRWGETWEPKDLSHITEFVFGVKGQPNQIKVEFEDDGGTKTIINSPELPGLDEAFAFWTIDAEDIDIDLSEVKMIGFVVDEELAAPGNLEGEFMVYVDGLTYTSGDTPSYDVYPADPGEAPLTILPDRPFVKEIAQTEFTQNSTSNFTIPYISSVHGWRAVEVTWADAQTRDLSGESQLVFGARGDPNSVKVEIYSSPGGKTTFHLLNVSDSYQHWIIPADQIAHMGNIKNINFVVDQGPDGEISLFVGGLRPSPLPTPPDDLPITVMPVELDVGSMYLTEFTLHSSTYVTMDYAFPNEYGMDGIRMHVPLAFGETEYEPFDLSSITNEFVFGLRGDPNRVQLAFMDMDGHRTIFHLQGVSDELQHWHIDASLIDNLDDMKEITFEVIPYLAENNEGSLDVFVGGLYWPPGHLDPFDPGIAPVTILPNEPMIDVEYFDFTEEDQIVRNSANSFTLQYDLPDLHSWDAVALTWGWNPQNLSSITQFVFGVKGDSKAIKVEFEYGDREKTRFHLNGVTDELQHWHIDASVIENLHGIKAIIFVVDADKAGTGTGEFTVYVDGLVYTVPGIPPGEASITILPDRPVVENLAGTHVTQHSSTNFTVHYDLFEPPLEQGVTVRWEDGLPRDLTNINEFVLGARGTPNMVRVEFVDSEGARSSFNLLNVETDLHYYHIDSDQVDNLYDIAEIRFLVNFNMVGEVENYEGNFAIHIGGLKYDDGEQTDGIPNSWWDEYDVPEEERVADSSPPSGHRFTYKQNFIAGTDPNDPESLWLIEGSETDPEQGEGFSLHWNAIPGRVYRVERSPNLLENDPVAGGFRFLTNIVSNSTGPYEFVDEDVNGLEGSLYRVRVELAE